MIRIIVLLFLFSNFSFLQNKDNSEQTKFDFPGYTLKGCLGSELSKPKRQVAKLPSKQAQKVFKGAFPFSSGRERRSR